MMTGAQAFVTVLIVAAVTWGTRAVSFVLFPAGKQAPRFVAWLSAQLPRAVMAMLLIYCLKDLSFAQASGFIPALLGVTATALIHLWKRHMMLSILCGTAVYMILIRLLG